MIDETSYEFQERVALKIDSYIPEAEAIRQTREEFTSRAQKNAIEAAKTPAQGKLALGENPRRR